MDTYNKITDTLNKNNCTLITSFEDFEEKRNQCLKKSYHFVRIEFIGICGHKSSAVVTNFTTRGTGKKCKDCIKKESQSKQSISNQFLTNKTEYNSIEILEKYLSPYYQIIRTNEGCLADLAIKEIENECDEWIPIQIKSTNKISHKMYSFRKLNNN